MLLNLRGKTAMVTGASRGIGLAIAKCLAREGCNVRLVSRSQEILVAEAQKIQQDYAVQAQTFVADLSDWVQAQKLLDFTGVPDIVVNNAGAITSTNLPNMDQAQLRKELDLKLFGYLAICQHAWHSMSLRGSGVIINILGTSGERPRPDHLVSTVANAGLMAFTKAIGAISPSKGVRVVGVNPGQIATQRLFDRSKQHAQSADHYPFGHPYHVAALVAFLASDASAHTSGTIITVDGGASNR
jgi:NAD(P)-dependent dehydrogenase (short-subunit alcohol dehydrogenase family)